MNSLFEDILTPDERQLVADNPESGFIDAFIKWSGRKTDAPLYSLEGAALMALSLSAGDTVVLPNPFSEGHVHMNLFVMLVGPSTTMRKTTVLNNVMGLVPKNAQTHQHYIQVVDDVSVQGLNKAAAEAGKQMAPLLLNIDEVAGLFETSKAGGSYLKGFDKVLMKCYDHTPVMVYRTTGSIESPRGAFTNVFAASTPEPLMEALGADDFASGLLPRFLIFDARDAQRGERRSLRERMMEREDWEAEADALREFLYQIARDRASGVPIGTNMDGTVNYGIKEVPFTPEAIDRLDIIDKAFSEQAGTDPSAVAAIKGRGFWHMYKLSGLFALSRAGREATVELVDVLRAINLVETTLSDLVKMQDEVGASPIERNINLVLKNLSARKDRRLPQTFIANSMKLTVQELANLRGTMLGRGLVVMEKDENSGDLYWRKA